MAAALCGCGSDEAPRSQPPDDGPKPGFVAGEQPAGPRIWIDGRLEGDERAVIEIWAAELGPVFGYSLHLAYDAGHLSPDAATAPAAAPVLGPDPAEAVYLAGGPAGDVALGGTRRSPTLGEADLGAPAKLGELRVVATAAASSQLGLGRVVVRRADGSYVAVETAGGTLTTGGAR